jgi:hypothetical protein
MDPPSHPMLLPQAVQTNDRNRTVLPPLRPSIAKGVENGSIWERLVSTGLHPGEQSGDEPWVVRIDQTL